MPSNGITMGFIGGLVTFVFAMTFFAIDAANNNLTYLNPNTAKNELTYKAVTCLIFAVIGLLLIIVSSIFYFQSQSQSQ